MIQGHPAIEYGPLVLALTVALGLLELLKALAKPLIARANGKRNGNNSRGNPGCHYDPVLAGVMSKQLEQIAKSLDEIERGVRDEGDKIRRTIRARSD